jgi:hypothetical protein
MLGTSLLLLAGEVFVLALPSLPYGLHSGRFVRVGEWSRDLLECMSWIAFGVAACWTAACWYFRPAGLALRLARGIALGVAVFHCFFAPGSGTYGRLLWGSC